MRVQAGSGVYWAFVAGVFFLYWACAGSRQLRLAAVLLANYIFCARFGLFYVFLIPACSSLDYLAGLASTGGSGGSSSSGASSSSGGMGYGTLSASNRGVGS